MPIAIPYDTAAAIGAAAAKCESRSLYASRFADPTSEKDDRKGWFQGLIAKKAIAPTPWHPPAATLLHAQLKARLMVNMAGGVMENAGLQLDRYGLPIIPGSAVKGCARRAALAALREWCETGVKSDDEGNLFKDLCAGFTTPAEMLTAIAHTFGWVEKDWSTADADHSDFAWACKQSSETFQEVATPLGSKKQFAGSIAFLDARPNKDPDLVLDVLTPHHTKYYESNTPNAVATDTEDPVPVFFPAIKEQNGVDHFTFPLVPLRRSNQSLLTLAREALRTGLEVFGLGAKTNAGYGWFEILSESAIQQATSAKLTASSDYPTDAVFKGAVLDRLSRPGEYQILQVEIGKLKDSKNTAWIAKLTTALTGSAMKETRKRLKEKDWFPKEWLPQ